MRKKLYTAPLVRKVQEMLKGTDGYSLEAMAKMLNDANFLTVRGLRWTPTNVHNFITRYGGPEYSKRPRKLKAHTATSPQRILLETVLTAGYNNQQTANIIEAIYGA